MRFRAYAKVNLSLEVLGKRPDGYHDLVSVMQTVSLWDEIDFEESMDLRFAASDPSLSGDDNLVKRAADLLRQQAPARPGGSLVLHKAIPHAAGLGGGSSDAAATLKFLNDRWELKLSLQELVDLGALLGSDVPFFLYGGTSLVTGRGEFVTPLPEPETIWYALAKPAVSVSTGTVFEMLTRGDWSDGSGTRQVAACICEGRTVTPGPNGLQRSVFLRYPEARACFSDVDGAAPGRTFMTGSGPTVVALCSSQAEARRVVATVKRDGWWTAVAHSVASSVA